MQVDTLGEEQLRIRRREEEQEALIGTLHARARPSVSGGGAVSVAGGVVVLGAAEKTTEVAGTAALAASSPAPAAVPIAAEDVATSPKPAGSTVGLPTTACAAQPVGGQQQHQRQPQSTKQIWRGTAAGHNKREKAEKAAEQLTVGDEGGVGAGAWAGAMTRSLVSRAPAGRESPGGGETAPAFEFGTRTVAGTFTFGASSAGGRCTR
eukprot:g12688.t1